MDGKMDVKTELDKQRDVAEKRTRVLSEEAQKRKDEEAKKAAEKPAKD
jgi:hypothetical protein